ncbi:MAG: YtxH domain-containing protein [bacterium]|nr:YtxH domain-containing protein [bacterium]
MSRDYDRSDNSFQSGVFGLVLGFLAGAAAVILSDPEKREKVKEKTAELVDKTKTTVLPTVIDKIAETVREKTDKIQEDIEEIEKKEV